ncbi:MAG: SMC family ATPase [Chloroflexi bacterium]|nr:SMC family ATPase [Chloroflexota bacterium]MBV9893991.1 SMC family ATPase [Chloroflexota bacterium]
MIPIALNIRNFMSYTEAHEPLRFDGIHVAVLTGDNGHGKSALLDAITWALWGRARGRSVDELIHSGAAEMEVEFEFALDEQHYRVIRKRQRRGRGGVSDLQFAVLAGEGFRPLTERSVSETERLIERTLRMSYETFTNSSFIQQGRADSFTTNSPAERKRILAEILELGYYDELESRAKERFKTCEAQLLDERRLSQEWEAEIARKSVYQAELDRLRAELGSQETQLNHLDDELSVVREQVTRLEALQHQLEEAQGRLERFTVERTRIAATLRERKFLREEAQKVLARAAEIERGAAELDAVRANLEQMTQKQHTFLPLERAHAAAARTLAAEQARLEGEVVEREKRLAEVRKASALLPSLQAQLRRAHSEATTLSQVEAQHAELQAIVGRSREDAAEKRTINSRLKSDMFDLRARLDELQTLSTCPTCKRPMDGRHKQRLSDELVAQGTKLRDDFRANEAQCRALETAIARDEALVAQAAAALLQRETVLRRLAQTESALAQAEEALRQANALERELTERQQLLGSARFAPDARRELAHLDRQIAALAYDEQRHAELRARATEFAGAERDRQLLEQARLSAEHLDAQILELQASLERAEAECAADSQRCAMLEEQTRVLPVERARLGELTTECADARRLRDETRDRCLFAQTKLDNCAFLERKQRDSLERQDALRREQSIFGDLAYAFGRRGVQAMIIETAIPEIEEEANRILSRMTDGRMHVKFETQRDVRSGLGTIETLDIKISDELGTRSYEMFSGGEGFRVNFAIRIALSRLLAHRAGTRLQLLVVDEGFGSQDQEGRDRVVEAIQAIESEFEKILVITHLEDLRERFPVRIEVTKTGQGSTYRVL